MAPIQTVHQPQLSHNPLTPRHGVVTLSGYGISARVDRGHLLIEDGIGADRHSVRLPRVNHGLKRVICVADDGFVTLGALRWLSAVGASFTMLNRTGKLLYVTGPNAPADARLRRAQGVALGNGVGIEISRKLIDAKLQGQEHLVREDLRDYAAAQEIAEIREKLITADSFSAIRVLEAHAALSYFGAAREVPVMWPKADLSKIPAHWAKVGSRRSPLSGGPRLAVTPVQAVLNFCFALLEAEARRAVVSLGLDPLLGLGLHTDTPNRDSLVFDVLEPVRVDVERWVLHWIKNEPLRKVDFFETETGNCRLMARLCTKLSETAPTWGKLVAPWAEYVAKALWASTSPSKSERRISTPLTQQHRREAKGRPSFAQVVAPKTEHFCRGCGKPARSASSHCANCAIENTKKQIIEVARIGRIASRMPEAIAKQSATQRRHNAELRKWNPSAMPVWLAPEMFSEEIQPALARTSATAIARAMGVSIGYAGRIREGYRPHQRHWETLAKLIGISGFVAGGANKSRNLA